MKTKFYIGIVLVLLLSLLSGCGGTDLAATPTPVAQPTPTTAQQSNPIATTQVAEQPTSTQAASTQPTTSTSGAHLTLWHWETPPARVTGFQAVLDQFKNDTGITVDQVPINAPDYQTKILAAISSDTLPDLMFVNPPNVPLLIARNAIVPVDDIYNSLNSKVEFYDALAAPYVIGGKRYAIPLFGLFWPLLYRADLYQAAGLNPPQTWDDALADAEKLTKAPDVYGFCLPVSSNGNYGSQVVWSFLRSNGGDIVNVVNGKEQIVFNSPKTVETYDFLAKLAKFSPPGKENMDWTATELLIKTGKCATVMYNSAWLAELSKSNPDLLSKYAMTHMPVAPGGQQAHTGYPRGLVVTATGQKHIDAVKQFLDWLYQPEHHAALLNAEPTLFLPVDKATAESQAYLGNPIVAANLKLVQAQTDLANTVTIIGFTGSEPAAHASQIENSFILGKVFQKIVLEGMTPEQAVTWGQQQYEAIISR